MNNVERLPVEREGQAELEVLGLLRTFESDGYVHFLDCDDGFMGIYICQNLNCIL